MPSRSLGLLISRCLCGAAFTADAELAGDPPIDVLRCSCGVAALKTDESAETIEQSYRGEYHASRDRHPGCVPYKDRYEHDLDVANLRIEAYLENFDETFETVETALDVGAANGAFVDALRAIGVEAWGLDPDPAMAREHIVTGTLPHIGIEEQRFGDVSGFDLVTIHDVLEHVVDPGAMLAEAVALLTPDGFMIVDVPDVAVPAGAHHYKREHLWFFTEAALVDLIQRAGLALTEVYRPIPGKLVVAARRRW